MVPLKSQTWSFYTFLKWDSIASHVYVYKPRWHKIVSDTSFTASVAQFVNRWLLKFVNSEYTFFANISSDILWSRFMKHKTDMWHAVLGGSLPYSPTIIVLLVVTLIHSIHRAYHIIVIDKLHFWCQRLAWFICVCLFYRDIIFYTPSSIQWKSDICNTTHNSNTIHDLPILASRVWMPLEDTRKSACREWGWHI